jgi:hypothetical protein
MILSLLAFAAPSRAEDTPGDDMQVLREALRTQKKALIAENVPLSPSEADAFWPVYEQYQARLEALDQRTTALISTYSQHYLALGDELASDLLEELLAIHREREALRTSFLPRFREVLPAKKLARYYQLENKIRAVIDYDLARQIPLVK